MDHPVPWLEAYLRQQEEMMARKQTPLETLARDHNWRMGRLRRDRCCIASWKCPSARIAGLHALDVEMKVAQDEFEEERTRLRQMATV